MPATTPWSINTVLIFLAPEADRHLVNFSNVNFRSSGSGPMFFKCLLLCVTSVSSKVIFPNFRMSDKTKCLPFKKTKTTCINLLKGSWSGPTLPAGSHFFFFNSYLPYNKCPVIFMWIRIVLSPLKCIRIFFALLSTDRTFLFLTSFLKDLKYFGLATAPNCLLSLVLISVQTSFIVRPTIVLLRPIVVVSTSGNSGILFSSQYFQRFANFRVSIFFCRNFFQSFSSFILRITQRLQSF